MEYAKIERKLSNDEYAEIVVYKEDIVSDDDESMNKSDNKEEKKEKETKSPLFNVDIDSFPIINTSDKSKLLCQMLINNIKLTEDIIMGFEATKEDINSYCEIEGRPLQLPILYATAAKCEQSVLWLIYFGADVYKVGRQCHSVTMAIEEPGYESILKLLLLNSDEAREELIKRGLMTQPARSSPVLPL